MPSLPRIKAFKYTIGSDVDPLDVQVNKWLDETGNELLSGSLCVVGGGSHQLRYIACYRSPDVNVDPNMGFMGTVVSREVEKTIDGVTERDYCMAGVFPVPEYWVLSQEDSEPAPPVLLSPDCDLTPYSDWFCIPGEPACQKP